MWGDTLLPPIFESEFIGATTLRFGLDKTESRYISSFISITRVSDLGVTTSELSLDGTMPAVYPLSTISSSSMMSRLVCVDCADCELIRISLSSLRKRQCFYRNNIGEISFFEI
jgi:hypothetical protein